MTDTTVTRNDQDSRYEIHVDGELAGIIEYQVSGDRIAFTHTEVFEKHRGDGTAGTLAGESLKHAGASGLTIVPECPYIARYLERHDVEGVTVEPAQ